MAQSRSSVWDQTSEDRLDSCVSVLSVKRRHNTRKRLCLCKMSINIRILQVSRSIAWHTMRRRAWVSSSSSGCLSASRPISGLVSSTVRHSSSADDPEPEPDGVASSSCRLWGPWEDRFRFQWWWLYSWLALALRGMSVGYGKGENIFQNPEVVWRKPSKLLTLECLVVRCIASKVSWGTQCYW